MKKLLLFLFICQVLFSCGSNSDPNSQNESDSSSENELPKAKFSSYEDVRDGQSYKTVNVNGKIWLAENINFFQYPKLQGWNFPSENTLKKEMNKGGTPINKIVRCLYRQELSKHFACPEGWRLPTKTEYKELANYFNNDFKNMFAKLDDALPMYNNGVTNEFGLNFYPTEYPTETGRKNRIDYSSSLLGAEYWTADGSITFIAPFNGKEGEISDYFISPVCIRCIQDINYVPEEIVYEGFLNHVEYVENGKSLIVCSKYKGDVDADAFVFYLENNKVDLMELIDTAKYEAYKQPIEGRTDVSIISSIATPVIHKHDYSGKEVIIKWIPGFDDDGYAYPKITSLKIRGTEIGKSVESVSSEIK